MTTTRTVFVQRTASKQIAYWHTDQKTAQLSGFLLRISFENYLAWH